MVKRIRRGHLATKICTEIYGGIWRTQGRNIGVFQGSAFRALLFIIYMGEMVEDYAAKNRRPNLITRIVQDMPHEQDR